MSCRRQAAAAVNCVNVSGFTLGSTSRAAIDGTRPGFPTSFVYAVLSSEPPGRPGGGTRLWVCIAKALIGIIPAGIRLAKEQTPEAMCRFRPNFSRFSADAPVHRGGEASLVLEAKQQHRPCVLSFRRQFFPSRFDIYPPPFCIAGTGRSSGKWRKTYNLRTPIVSGGNTTQRSWNPGGPSLFRKAYAPSRHQRSAVPRNIVPTQPGWALTTGLAVVTPFLPPGKTLEWEANQERERVPRTMRMHGDRFGTW